MNNASREAYGYKLQADNDRLNAKMSRRQGNIGAVGTILTTPLNAWGAYKVAGGTGSIFDPVRLKQHQGPAQTCLT